MGERKNYSIEELEGSVESYLSDLRKFMTKHGIEELLAPPVDHVAVKARDSVHYSEIVGGFLPKTTLASFTRMDGRQIATLELSSPIYLDELGETLFVEIMEPKPEKVGRDLVGFEHIEIYNPDLEGVIRMLDEKGVTYEDGGNLYHRTVVVKINDKGQEVKFTNGRLGEIVRRQTEDGIGVVVKSSDGAEQ